MVSRQLQVQFANNSIKNSFTCPFEYAKALFPFTKITDTLCPVCRAVIKGQGLLLTTMKMTPG